MAEVKQKAVEPAGDDWFRRRLNGQKVEPPSMTLGLEDQGRMRELAAEFMRNPEALSTWAKTTLFMHLQVLDRIVQYPEGKNGVGHALLAQKQFAELAQHMVAPVRPKLPAGRLEEDE